MKQASALNSFWMKGLLDTTAWETRHGGSVCIQNNITVNPPLESVIVRDKKRSVLYDFSEDTDCNPTLSHA